MNPFINGLSDHDAQIITILNIDTPIPGNGFYFTRITDNSIFNFTLQLSCKNWNNVFLDENVSKIFNNFHNTYLRIFYTSFAIKKNTTPVSQSHGYQRALRFHVLTKENFI